MILIKIEIRDEVKISNRMFSTFFWYYVKNFYKMVSIEGKGYGHGVGLSQEGGMQMAKVGYTYEDIIHYYFKDVVIISPGIINSK